MKKLTLYLFFLLFIKMGFAQQDPEFTHYMYNMNVINPAYATGTPEVIDFGAFYRTQWVNATGSPQTFSFFTHLPLNNKIETGLSFISDEIGEGALKENNIFADFAYILKLNDKLKLSLGVKAGITFLDTDFSNFRLESGDVSTDAAFQENLHKTFPNFGTGAFLFHKDYYIGLSAPNFLNSKHLDDPDGIQRLGNEEIHTYLTGGYVYQLNSEFKLKPSFLIRNVKGAPLMYDLSFNVKYVNRFELGASYRLDDSVSGMFSIGITPNLSFGYAYDYTITNLGNYNSGTHEFFLLYDLSLLSGYNKSPRFF